MIISRYLKWREGNRSDSAIFSEGRGSRSLEGATCGPLEHTKTHTRMASPSGLWGGLGRLYLGSKSWSRRQMLEEMGVPVFSVIVSDFDESSVRDPDPHQLVLALAHGKANALLSSSHPELVGLQQQQQEQQGGGGVGGTSERSSLSSSSLSLARIGKSLLITGDSVVTHKGMVLEKPRSKEEARALLRSYATAPATTVSSIVVVDLGSGARFEGVAAAEVYFRPLPREVMDELVESGASMETAGGLRIEHAAVQPYIDCIIGEKSAVMGFCQALAGKLIREALQ
jgi:MAF protein